MRRTKNAPSSSSSSFDSARFVFAAVAKRYNEIFSVANAISERGLHIPHDSIDERPLLTDVETLGWRKYVETPKQRGILPIVREFYANFPEHQGGTVYVRGRRVPFDRETIQRFFNLPDINQEECDLRALLDEPQPDYQEISRVLGDGREGAVWTLSKQTRKPLSIQLTQFNLISACWAHFIFHHMIPASHVSDVNRERVFLTYCIRTHQQIDVAYIMFNQVMQVATKSNPTLFCPSLITALCKRAGVKWPDTEPLMDRKGPISAANIREGQRKKSCCRRGSSSQAAQDVQAPSSSSAQPQEAGPQDVTLAQISEQITQLRDEVRENHQIQMARGDYRDACIRIINDNFRQLVDYTEGRNLQPNYQDFPPPLEL